VPQIELPAASSGAVKGAGGFGRARVMTFHSNQRKPAYRPDIDGLRAAAVLAVVFYHAEIPCFSGGFVGVDVFFVISGFLITRIVWSGIEDRQFSLQDFYVRRIKRIFPALFTVLLLCSIAAFLFLIPSDLEKFGQAGNSAILFYSNFYWLKHTEYFDPPARENLLLHTWSLAVEEQFYGVWPLILLLLSKVKSIKKPVYIIVALALISFLLAEARLPGHAKDAFCLPWCRAWELLIGAALAVTPSLIPPGRLAAALTGAGLTAIALAVTLYEPSIRFPGAAALLPCGGAALIIAAGHPQTNPLSALLAAGPARRIGLISYSLYLIHWPMFSLAHIYWAQELSLPLRLSLVLASLVLAYLSWRFIETPVREVQSPKLRVFGVTAAAMAFLCATATSFVLSAGFPSRAGEMTLRVEEPGGSISKYCRPVREPSVRGATTICELGADRGGTYDFVLWGDSHAQHFVPAIATLAKARHLSGMLFSRGACHPFLGDTHAVGDCQDFNTSVALWTERHPVKLAILAGRWNIHRNYLENYAAQSDPLDNTGGLSKTLAFLTKRGLAVAVLDQVPEFPFEVSSCIAKSLFYRRDSEFCVTQPAAAFKARHSVLDHYFAFLKKRYNFSLSNAAEVTCGQEQCQAKDGDTLLMVDSHHLTEAGSLRTIPYLNIPLLKGPAEDKKAPAPSKAASAL
jgi:peptidoglycan/LPS O-acetylase OafA/YrhL